MAYLVRAAAYRPDGSDQHYTATRWRSDDPWGAIWRCLYDVAHAYIEYPPPPEEKRVLQLTIDLHFKPDIHNFTSPLFPADPLAQHRPPRAARKPRNDGKSIPAS